jgi:hypothetical protein
LTDRGTVAGVNLLLLAAEGKRSRELPVARDQVLPAPMGLLVSDATHTAHHRAVHTGEPYIADRRWLDRPIIDQVLVRTAADPDRLVPLAEIMQRDPAGRFRQTRSLARGGGMSILIVFGDWVLDTLHAPSQVAGPHLAPRRRDSPAGAVAVNEALDREV